MEGEETVEEAETCEEGEERRRRRKKENIEESEGRWVDPPKVTQEVLADLKITYPLKALENKDLQT